MELIEFWTICSANGIVLTKNQIDQLSRFHKELIYWNKSVNLISRQDEEFIMERHILHSLSILKYIHLPQKAKCIDVGTGGGLPGIPIAVANPFIEMLLVDSIAKKIKITEMLASHTGSKKIFSRCGRVEELISDKKFAGYYNFVFARAVADIEKIIGWVDKLLKPGGQIVLLKGGDLDDEISVAEKLYPGYKMKETKISIVGYDWYAENDKKLIVCQKVK